ncbi:MAG TPA: hypothetical protein VJZ76_04030 [Thermoanaerobaculia bacterium]|nr:hypothetical protein [Thermoanaerobaculia bacterium]
MCRRYWREAIGALVVLCVQIAKMPRTPWENDEFLFAEAVKKFEPTIWAYHPHPPGFPLFVLLGKAMNEIVGDPWRALVILNILAAPIGFVAMSRAFRRWIDDADLAVCGAFLYYFSASYLLHGSLAFSDPIAMTFVALAFYCIAAEGEGEHARAAIGIGLWSSAAIGCRPQIVIAMTPALIVAFVRLSDWRKRMAMAISFIVASLMWFLPLLDAAGSWSDLLTYERQQARYFVAHDAAMSRGAKSTTEIAIRFVLHGWGSKYLTLPLIVLVVLGLVPAWRRRHAILPVVVFGITAFAFQLGWMDPADAARYSLSSMIFTALLAAFGLWTIRASTHVRLAPWIVTVIFALGSYGYVRPIVSEMASKPSPPAAAAAYANTHYPPNTVILWDASLRPAAEYLMPRFKSAALERGLRDHYHDPDVPLVLFNDGGSTAPDALTFSWRDSDAYGKLTRNHYRVVTLDPVRPIERYLPLSGVYALERTPQGEEWRWLARDATIRIPPLGPVHAAELRFRISPDAPYDSNDVRVFINGREVGAAAVKKGETTPLVVSIPRGGFDLRIVSEHSFRPADVLHNQDPRSLATQLVYFVEL